MTRHRPRLTCEQGFTMIELLVVGLITGILMAIAVPTFISARTNSEKKAIKTAAAQYDTAAHRYMLDHGNLPPVLGGPDWPTPLAGPVDKYGKPYMQSTPAIMDQPGMQLVTSGACSGSFNGVIYTTGTTPTGYPMITVVACRKGEIAD